MRVVHKEQSEITMDYVNLPDASARGLASNSRSGEHGEVTAAASGRKLYRLVAVSFGLLCILQAALNISLRLALYSSGSKTTGTEANCKNLTDELKRKLIDFDHYFQEGWVYFHPSLYYISSIKKTWQESRDDCHQRDADLVIINSKEEQDFTRKFHKLTWIGLTKRETIWKWVDGTQLTKSYWSPGEPNGYEGKTEDCVEIRFHDKENSWNDIPCKDQNFWICEKMVSL
ncbi:CD209 antigen-like protein A [Thunnus maccoyii]|uniref:CD209 antigen-like protein A n=1 Tax=Thunnus maccoyii TaxID=8240 RepID=UPI001C4BB915|nr:CD209 antigen-like protein A [Thunnus maccoyii]